MLQTLNFKLSDPRWHNQLDGGVGFIKVHFTATDKAQHLVVLSPNWANALKWGEQAALKAWLQLKEGEAGSALKNPSDPNGLQMWVLRPGFPKPPTILWQEPFSYYAPGLREGTLVYRIRPVFGTDTVTFEGPRGVTAVSAELGISLLDL